MFSGDLHPLQTHAACGRGDVEADLLLFFPRASARRREYLQATCRPCGSGTAPRGCPRPWPLSGISTLPMWRWATLCQGRHGPLAWRLLHQQSCFPLPWAVGRGGWGASKDALFLVSRRRDCSVAGSLPQVWLSLRRQDVGGQGLPCELMVTCFRVSEIRETIHKGNQRSEWDFQGKWTFKASYLPIWTISLWFLGN